MCSFLENSPFRHTFKKEISDLVFMISEVMSTNAKTDLANDIYLDIFALAANLKYLDLDIDHSYSFTESLLNGLPSTTYHSSNIVHLRIRMYNFDDCLCLLDGRLSQLHTFIVYLDYIRDTSRIIDNTVKNSIILISMRSSIDSYFWFLSRVL